MNDLKKTELYLREYSIARMRIDVLVESKKKIDKLAVFADATTQELMEAIDKVVDQHKQIRDMIESIEDPEIRTVLEYRYYRQLTFSAIAKKLYISKTKVQNLHREGLTLITSRYQSHIETHVKRDPCDGNVAFMG